MREQYSETSVSLDRTSLMVVSATFVYHATPYASERAVFGDQCLIGSPLTKRRYQHLSCVIDVLVPVRYPFDTP